MDLKITFEEQERVSKLPFTLHKNLRSLLDVYKFAINHKNTSIVIIVDGKSGKGKSTLSFQAGAYCDVDFSLHKIFFTPEEFLEGLSNAKKGDVIIFDEAMLVSNRSTMSSINRMIIVAMSMIRSKNIIVIFNLNSIFDLDRNLALHRADLLLHVYSEGITDRGRFMAFYQANDGYDRIKQLYLLGKKFYNYSRPKANFFTTFSSWFMVDEKEYEKRKQEGINKFLKGGEKNPFEKSRLSRDNYIKWMRQNTALTLNSIAGVGELSEKTIRNVLKGSITKK